MIDWTRPSRVSPFVGIFHLPPGSFDRWPLCWSWWNMGIPFFVHISHIHPWPGGGFKHFYFKPYLGMMIQFHDHIFQMGWNHQPKWELSIYIFTSIYLCPWEWYINLCRKNPCERPPKPPTFWNSYTRTLILDTIMKLSGTIGVTQKTMTLDTHVRLILLQTLNPQERWGTHKKRWPFQPRLFADVIGLVRCSCDDCAFGSMKTKHEQMQSFMYIGKKMSSPFYVLRDTVFVTT